MPKKIKTEHIIGLPLLAFLVIGALYGQSCSAWHSIGLHPSWIAKCWRSPCPEASASHPACAKKWKTGMELTWEEELPGLIQQAEKGDLKSQLELADYYDRIALMDRPSEAQNHDAAIKWYRIAAEQGASKAQSAIGRYILLGWLQVPEGTKHLEAEKWLLKAAMQGEKGAQSKLASFYENGTPLEVRDPVKAYFWSAIYGAGTKDSRVERGNKERLEKLAQALSPEQIEEVKRNIAQWKPVPEKLVIIRSFL